MAGNLNNAQEATADVEMVEVTSPSPSIRTQSVSSLNTDNSPMEPPNSPSRPGDLFDVDVEHLVMGMYSSNFDKTAAMSALRYVPKSYLMQGELKDDEFAALALTAKRTGKYNSSNIGFDPKAVINSNSIHCLKHEAKHSTLVNPVHPIFAYERFLGIPESIYKVLLPALRLVTLFLLEAPPCPYFYTLAFGTRAVDLAESAKKGHPMIRIKECNDQHRTDWQEIVNNMVKHVQIVFGVIGPHEKRFGTMWIPSKRQLLPLDPSKHHACNVGLHNDLLTTAHRLAVLGKNAEPDQVLRFHFFFAINLIHETCHVFEVNHNHPKPEAFMGDNTFNEAGEAWEVAMFGGRVHPINARMDCAYGLATYDWPFYNTDVKPAVFYTAPMDYISQIQQEDFWEYWRMDQRDSKPKDPEANFCHIPRTGAKAIGENAFSMLVSYNQDVKAIHILFRLVGQTINKPRSKKKHQDGDSKKRPHRQAIRKLAASIRSRLRVVPKTSPRKAFKNVSPAKLKVGRRNSPYKPGKTKARLKDT